ncbi:hypothetical protein BC940DRAFT_305899 [Gongronella butleri]|nr:hypothetical protein BC940DRAFT_305899 [Gongronella butleri]
MTQPRVPLPQSFDDVESRDVLKFKEFNLNPLEVTGTEHLLIPHQHRDTTRVFNLCLQPIPGSPLANSLKKFQDKSYIACGPNQAHQSPPHLSLLGHIPIERLDDYARKWQHVDTFQAIVKDEVKRVLSASGELAASAALPMPTFGGYMIKDKPTRSVAMRVAVPRVFMELANAIHTRLISDLDMKLEHPCAPVPSSSTAIQRMPLAYNVLHSIDKHDAQRIRDMANDTIDVKPWCNKDLCWELSLQEILLHSQVVGEAQQVRVIKTWPLDTIGLADAIEQDDIDKRKSMALVPFTPKKPLPYSKPHTTGFSLIPASIRVKLSIISTWFR